MRTLAIVNQKGGCGKTTTAIHLGATLARRGLRTLLVDLDPQAHCAAGLGVPEREVDYSIADALIAESSEIDVEGLIWKAGRGLDLAPSTMRLAAVEAPGGGLHDKPDKDRRLEAVLEVLAPRYDWCLIDCPPTIGLLTFNALRAARETLIPVETGYFALRGAQKQWETIQRVIAHIGRPIACHLVPTMHDEDSELARDILASLRRRFAGQILPVVIRSHPELRAAASVGQGIIDYAPESEARADFEALVDWLLDHERRPYVPSIGADVEIGIVRRDPPPAPGTPSGRAAELVARLREPESETLVQPASSPAATDSSRALSVAPPPEPEAEPSPPAPAAAPRYGALVTGERVRFVQPAEGATSIAVAGSLTGWVPVPLDREDALGVFRADVRVTPGRHVYRLIVDGRWLADPYNAEHERNDHGEMNSVVTVSPPTPPVARLEPPVPPHVTHPGFTR